MIKITLKTNVNTNAIAKQMLAIVEKRANEIVNKKMSSLRHEIAKEPGGKFLGTFKGDKLTIAHSGFSPELAAKIDRLLL